MIGKIFTTSALLGAALAVRQNTQQQGSEEQQVKEHTTCDTAADCSQGEVCVALHPPHENNALAQQIGGTESEMCTLASMYWQSSTDYCECLGDSFNCVDALGNWLEASEYCSATGCDGWASSIEK